MFIIQINLDYRFAVLLLDIIVIFWVYCNYWILHFSVIGWYNMSISDIWCSWTDLEAQHCDGEEFQLKHPGVLSEKVIGCCLGLHTPCQCMWGSVEMADIRCHGAFTYHCRDQQAEVLVPRREHRRGTRASPPTLLLLLLLMRRRHRWRGRSRGLHRGERVRRSVGEESQPKHVNVLSEKVIDLCLHAPIWNCGKGEFWLKLLKVPNSAYKYRQYTGE